MRLSIIESDTLPYVKQIACGILGAQAQSSVTTYRSGKGWEGREGGDICMLMVDSC